LSNLRLGYTYPVTDSDTSDTDPEPNSHNSADPEPNSHNCGLGDPDGYGYGYGYSNGYSNGYSYPRYSDADAGGLFASQ
jgi:hypothetical protein